MCYCTNQERVVLSRESREEVIEERFRIRPGEPYRAMIGHNNYDGVLASIELHVCEKGFVPLRVELERGLVYDARDPSEKIPFEKETLEEELRHLRGFGRIADSAGFENACERWREKSMKIK